jgi:hypothetical protein
MPCFNEFQLISNSVRECDGQYLEVEDARDLAGVEEVLHDQHVLTHCLSSLCVLVPDAEHTSNLGQSGWDAACKTIARVADVVGYELDNGCSLSTRHLLVRESNTFNGTLLKQHVVFLVHVRKMQKSRVYTN